MKRWLALLLFLFTVPTWAATVAEVQAGPKRVVIIPIREDIMPPLVYLVRRGVKEAMEWHADLIVLDMQTNGGRLDTCEQIIDILNQFKGETVTYVDRNAYSAGALISIATQKIYMAPESVIGAAAPILMGPGGMGVQSMSGTLEVKEVSGLSAKMRAYAQKNGHNPDVVQAMMDKQKLLVIDGKVINPKGQILTLTNREAERKYGNPPQPLLSEGTVPNLHALLVKLGYANAEVKHIQPTGAEQLATWINAVSWLWLLIGIAGLYIEFKTPGFGLPGIVGISSFALYFLGTYIAGLSGLEWLALFILGLVLVALELFVFTGTVVLGLAGTFLMLVSLVMALVDHYPGTPMLPTLPELSLPLRQLGYAFVGAVIILGVLSRLLPKTPIYHTLVTHSTTGTESVQRQQTEQANQVGREGVALSGLRPSGKAQFGREVIDVMTQGDLLAKGSRVRIIGHSGHVAIVRAVVS